MCRKEYYIYYIYYNGEGKFVACVKKKIYGKNGKGKHKWGDETDCTENNIRTKCVFDSLKRIFNFLF